MTHRHAIPSEDKRLAFEVITEAGRIKLALAGDTATLAAIEQGIAAAARLRRLAATMATALHCQKAAAIRAERTPCVTRKRPPAFTEGHLPSCRDRLG